MLLLLLFSYRNFEVNVDPWVWRVIRVLSIVGFIADTVTRYKLQNSGLIEAYLSNCWSCHVSLLTRTCLIIIDIYMESLIILKGKQTNKIKIRYDWINEQLPLHTLCSNTPHYSPPLPPPPPHLNSVCKCDERTHGLSFQNYHAFISTFWLLVVWQIKNLKRDFSCGIKLY